MNQKYSKYILWTLIRHLWPIILILAFCKPKIKVHRSSEVLGCTETNRKAKTDMESTSKMDQNHSKYISRTLSHRFWPNILILAFCKPEMKVPRSSEVLVCTEINIKATRDIKLISEMDLNHLKYILWTLGRRFWPNILILAFLGPKSRKSRFFYLSHDLHN